MRSNKLSWFKVFQLMLLVLTILDQIESVLSKRKDGKCNVREFECENGLCILDLYFCDGFNTCGDDSDEPEEDCELRRCAFNEFRCNSGQCISTKWVCDGQKDCYDGEDEYKCYYAR